MKLLITYTKETPVDRWKNGLLKIPQKWTKAMIPASPSSFLVFKKFFNFNTYFLHPLFVLSLVYIPFYINEIVDHLHACAHTQKKEYKRESTKLRTQIWDGAGAFLNHEKVPKRWLYGAFLIHEKESKNRLT